MGASDVSIHTSTETEFRRRGESGSVRVQYAALEDQVDDNDLKVECLVGRKIYVSFVSTL